MADSFKAKSSLKVGSKTYSYFALKALEPKHKLARLPYSIKVLLENLLRPQDGESTTKADIEAPAGADFRKLPAKDITFAPPRLILHDFTGVPGAVDLAAMRDALKKLGGVAG